MRREPLLAGIPLLLLFAALRHGLEGRIGNPRFAVTESDLKAYLETSGLRRDEFLRGCGLTVLPEGPELTAFTQGRVFVPAPSADIDGLVHKYKRAYAERKRTLLVVPYHPGLAEGEELARLLERSRSKIAAFRRLTDGLPRPHLTLHPSLTAVLKALLAFLALAGIGLPTPAAALLGLPVLLVDAVPPVGWLSFALFTVLFTDAILREVREGNGAFGTLGRALGLLLYGGMVLSALGTSEAYLLGRAVPHGVTLGMLAAFAAALRRSLAGVRPDEIVPASVPLAILLAGLLAVLLARNGVLLSLENAVREALEEVLPVRPRTRELLLGYPALGFLAVAGVSSPPWLRAGLLATAGVGVVSSLNSFLHLHAFLAAPILRTLIGYAIGAAAGVAAGRVTARISPASRASRLGPRTGGGSSRSRRRSIRSRRSSSSRSRRP